MHLQDFTVETQLLKNCLNLCHLQKNFKGNHVHSIVKKKRMKDEKLEREYPEIWSDFSLEVFDKSILNRIK